MSAGTFRVLMVFIDAEEAYCPPALAEYLPLEHIAALELAGAARPKSFLLLALRNWELEHLARGVRPPAELRLRKMPEGQLVERLLGHEDARRGWRPGVVHLPPAEARVFTMRIVERRSVAEVAWALGVRERTVVNHMTEARAKLRRHFGLAPPAGEGVPYSPGDLCLPAGLIASTGG